MRKKVIFILVLGVLAYIGYSYLYQNHRVIEDETSDFVVTSNSIFNEFSQNQTTSETKYLDKTISVSGIVTELNVNDLTLDNKIFCKFSKNLTTIKLQDKISVKGRCIGFDDLLEQVKLDQSSIINN